MSYAFCKVNSVSSFDGLPVYPMIEPKKLYGTLDTVGNMSVYPHFYIFHFSGCTAIIASL